MLSLLLVIVVLILTASFFSITEGFTKVLVPSIYDEYEEIGLPQWIMNETLKKELDYTVFLYQKLHPDQPNFMRNRGTEGGVYLKYIVDHYDNFPDVAIFVQAHPGEHQPHFLNWIRCISPMANFININNNRGCKTTQAWTKIAMWMEQCWRDTLKILWNLTDVTDAQTFNQMVPPNAPITICTFYENQFILSRAQMQLRPLTVWKDMLRIIYEQDRCHEGPPDYDNLYNKWYDKGEEPIDFGTEYIIGRPDKPGKGFGRHIQGGTAENLNHVIYGRQGLDMNYPGRHEYCQNFVPECPGSPCEVKD